MSVLNQLSVKSLYMLSIVAESESMKHAADKLCISPSALSHQMQRLEARLGKPLFIKDGRTLKFTKEAKLWSSGLSECFRQVDKVTTEFLGNKSNTIHLGIPSALAFSRITPKLGIWMSQHPSVDVRIRMLNCDDDIANLGLDMLISNQQPISHFTTEKVQAEQYIPVCSKAFYDSLSNQQKTNFHQGLNLLDLSNVNAWPEWGDQFSRELQPDKIIQFSHTILVLQAVLSGQGIALLDYYLVKEYLDSGMLVQLQNEPFLKDELIHRISVRTSRESEQIISELKTWLLSFFR